MRRTRWAAALLGLVAVASAGCPYRVTLTAEPAATTVTLPKGDAVALPAEVVLVWVPFGHQRISAVADGHRPLDLDLRRDEIRLSSFVLGTIAHPSTLWGRPRGEVRLVLVPEHGPAGTWDPAELD